MFAMSYQDALKRMLRGRGSAERVQHGIYFGGVLLPDEAATSHFMLAGSTGSGKSLQLRMMMGSVLPRILDTPDYRAVVFDVKQEVTSIVTGILQQAMEQNGVAGEAAQREIEERIIHTNPFDQRCSEWDLARDANSPEVALQIAATFIPEEHGNNRYFSDAARDLLAGALNVFIECAEARWNFADVLYALRSPVRLAHVLSQTEEGADLVELHLQGEATTRSVLSTLRARLAPFYVPAALWRHAGAAGRTFSLEEFLVQNRILLLGNYQAATVPVQAINRTIFSRLTQLILDQSEHEQRRNWVFLDEVRKLGKLDSLDDLMTNGRSKGAAVVLAFQDIDGMRAVYGKEEAGEITSMPASFGCLRVAGAETPRWASDIHGEQEVIQSLRNRSETVGGGQGFGSLSSSAGQSEQLREKKVFLPSAFRTLPRPERGKPLYGYFCSAFLENRPYLAEIPPHEVSARLPPRATPDLDFQPWPAGTSKRIPHWTKADYERLGIPPLDDAPPVRRAQPGQIVNRAAPDFVDPFATPPHRPRP